MVKYFKGDIFDAPIDAMTHGCNCFHTMGSGIARAVREYYPEAYEADVEQTKKGDKSKLGTLSEAYIPDYKTRRNPRVQYIFNLYEQYNFGREKRQVNYEALFRGFEALRARLTGKGLVLGINYKIACNLAGGTWSVCEAMIHAVFDSADFDVLICQRPGDE